MKKFVLVILFLSLFVPEKAKSQCICENIFGTPTGYVSSAFPPTFIDEIVCDLTAFLLIGIFDCGTLPVELIHFSVKNENHANLLTWKTVSEINNSHFEVERSADGFEWERIASIYGAGNSIEEITYTYKDRTYMNKNINYYRLKQVDYDGVFEYHDIISIKNDEERPILIGTYNLLGQRVNENFKGIVIKQYSDGTKKKIYRP